MLDSSPAAAAHSNTQMNRRIEVRLPHCRQMAANYRTVGVKGASPDAHGLAVRNHMVRRRQDSCDSSDR